MRDTDEPVSAREDMESAAVVVAMLVCGLSGALVGAVATAVVMWLFF